MDEIKAKLILMPDGRWKVSCRKDVSAKMAIRKTATSAFKYAENRLLKGLNSPQPTSLTSVNVIYDQSCQNETEATKDAISTVYALTCFMEEFLTPAFLAERTQKYLKLMKEAK